MNIKFFNFYFKALILVFFFFKYFFKDYKRALWGLKDLVFAPRHPLFYFSIFFNNVLLSFELIKLV